MPFTVLTVCRFVVYRFDRFVHFGFTVLHLAVSFFIGRFAVLSVSVLPFCPSVSLFCRSRFAVLPNSVFDSVYRFDR